MKLTKKQFNQEIHKIKRPFLKVSTYANNEFWFLVDCGAQYSCVSEDTFDKISKEPGLNFEKVELEKSFKLKSAGGAPMRVTSKYIIELKVKGRLIHHVFYVIEKNH